MIAFTIYSRPGCHLCDEMKAVVERVAGSTTPAATIDVIDISSDSDLESRYGLEIPVLMLNGKKAAKYRVNEEELARMVDARVEGAGGAGGAG
jgi:glutaredoxin